MWGGSISREQLQQQISLLALLGGVQESVKQHQLTSPSNYPSSLTIDQESEIVSNLSFLSSRRKDSKQVVAIAIEATEKSKEMVIRMAVNGEDAAYLKEGLVKIANILEKAACMDGSASYYTDLLLRQVITSDFSRISTRLQMSKKYPLTTSRIMILHLLLHESSLNDTNGIDLLRALVQALKQCYSSLKGLPQLQVNSTTCAMLEEVTKLAYRLANADLGAALEKSSQADKTQLIRLKDSVAKIGHYYKACSQLVAAAMRKKCSVFKKIKVEDYQVSFPQAIKSSKPTSILPVLKSQVEDLTDRNNIRKLLSFINPSMTRNGLETFTINIEVTKNTAIFWRDETATHEFIGPDEFKGYGHEFEKAYTTRQIGASTGHHRIITYRFGGLNFIVRHETDDGIESKPDGKSAVFRPRDTTGKHESATNCKGSPPWKKDLVEVLN
ncbi:hypothetical protein VE02_07019 [Pseudogymnoascus sp. 03VT05]|nr:hypothetical protein VE02_07019 [Pseudogymnoascus sp. 03VT05]